MIALAIRSAGQYNTRGLGENMTFSLTDPFTNTDLATLSPNGSVGQITCRDVAGKVIPYIAVPWAPVSPMPVRALMGGDNLAMEVGGKQYTFFVFWLGNPASFPARTAASETQLYSFIADRFGVSTKSP
jgi:hypothetical protein